MFEVIFRIYTNSHFVQIIMKSKSRHYTVSIRFLFESLPETRCSVNAIQRKACTEHLIPHRRMECTREWRAGRKICGTSATTSEPACYNVNMYHAEK